MDQEFEICGNHIPYEKIKDYCIVQREYIYRPSFIETVTVHKKMFQTQTSTEYKFDRMLPYAMILGKSDIEFKEATKNVLTPTLGIAVVKDLAVGALSIASDKINRKRFRCKNVAGRCFTTFLSDIPTVLAMSDGRIIDIYKNDPMYTKLNQLIDPTIQMIPALHIITKEKEYYFFGEGIHLKDVGEEYKRLRFEMTEYKESIKRLEASTKPSLESRNPFSKLFGKKRPQPMLENPTETIAQNDKADSNEDAKTEEALAPISSSDRR